MWRLLEAYAQASASGQERTAAFLADVSESHGRLRELACLPDIREARQQLEEELRRTNRLVEQKAQEDKDRMAALGRQVARLEHELAAVRGRADYDVLTGVLHRGAIERRLCALLAEGKPCTLAMLDLDNFKTVNDTLGHQIGDRLLTLVAEQLHRVTRAGDAVGRYGGDEFLFVAPGLNPEHLAQRLSTAVARRHVRLELEGRTVSVLLSLTVGITASRVGDDLPVVLERADRAMLSLKKAGKGGIRFASPEGPPPPAARLPEPITGGTG